MSNRIEARFAELRRLKTPAFMPFVTFGDPDAETTGAIIVEMEHRGADIVELGIPFSDPIADGPTIQASFTRALGAGASVRGALDMVRRLRRESQIPLVTMISYSLVCRVGVPEYIRRASGAGVDGVIVPDLPVEEAGEVIREARAKDLCTIFLAAPTTTPSRARLVVENSTGFIYYISVLGTTGIRDRLPGDLRQKIAALKSQTDKPVAVGFGVSTPAQAAAVGRVADGVIVGSAIVKKISECAGRPQDELLRAVGGFVESLARGAKGR